MKYLLILVLGAAIGIYVDRYVLPAQGGVKAAASGSVSSTRDAFDDKMRQWRLTPEDVRQDLARTGEVVRTQADVVGGKFSDERIVAVVKAKYILDRDLSASDIHVSVQDGRVTLTGSVGSPDFLGRAIALALDTEGVTGVDSKLAVSGS